MHRKSNSWDRQNYFREKWKFFAFLFAVFVFFYAFRERFLLSYGDWLSSSAYVGRADIAVVPNSHSGRLRTASKMYLNGEVDAIVTVASPPYLVRQEIERQKMNPSVVHVGECLSNTTFSDVLHAKDVVEEIGVEVREIVVVTDKYAIVRTQWIYQKVFGKKYVISAVEAIHPKPAKHKALTERYWWRDPVSRRYVYAETQKNLFYRLYYGLLNKDEEWDIPFFSVSDWLSDGRLRDSQMRFIRQTKAKERSIQHCSKK